MNTIPAGQMNFLEKCITFFLRCINRAKKLKFNYNKNYEDVFLDIVKIVNGLKILYLRRWFIWETEKGNLYLHRIVRSDDDKDPHTHPWPFTSLILWKGYFDFSYKMVQGLLGKHLECTVEETKLFHIYRRPATHLHKVLLLGGESWSLVWVGKYDKQNEWGYVLDDGTFVPYRKYLNLPDDAPLATFDRIDKQG